MSVPGLAAELTFPTDQELGTPVSLPVRGTELEARPTVVRRQRHEAVAFYIAQIRHHLARRRRVRALLANSTLSSCAL